MDERGDDAGKSGHDTSDPVPGQAFIAVEEMGDQQTEKSQSRIHDRAIGAGRIGQPSVEDRILDRRVGQGINDHLANVTLAEGPMIPFLRHADHKDHQARQEKLQAGEDEFAREVVGGDANSS